MDPIEQGIECGNEKNFWGDWQVTFLEDSIGRDIYGLGSLLRNQKEAHCLGSEELSERGLKENVAGFDLLEKGTKLSSGKGGDLNEIIIGNYLSGDWPLHPWV
jgi:hypothetical protein